MNEEVQYRGVVAYRIVFPVSQVAHIKGLHNDSSAWRKDGEVMFLSRLGKKVRSRGILSFLYLPQVVGLDQYGVVAIIKEPPEVAANLHWAKSTGAEGLDRLQKHFAVS